MATKLTVLLTNGETDEVEFLDDELQWTEEGAFLVFRDNKGRRVAYHTDVIAKFSFDQKWNQYADDLKTT